MHPCADHMATCDHCYSCDVLGICCASTHSTGDSPTVTADLVDTFRQTLAADLDRPLGLLGTMRTDQVRALVARGEDREDVGLRLPDDTLARACLRLIHAVCAHHPELADLRGRLLVLVEPLGADRYAEFRGNRRDQAGVLVHELVINKVGLERRSAKDVATTVIHEYAHAVLFERGITDTDGDNQHYPVFAETCQRLGLVVRSSPVCGWETVGLQRQVAADLSTELGEIEDALLHLRLPELLPDHRRLGQLLALDAGGPPVRDVLPVRSIAHHTEDRHV